MLIEKTGYTNFKVVDNSSNKFQLIDNMEFLTPFQEKQMSFQPDMILEYAHYLGDTFKKRGFIGDITRFGSFSQSTFGSSTYSSTSLPSGSEI